MNDSYNECSNMMELYYIIQLNFLLLPKNKRRMSITFKYDVLVIGGGHAGCEAATAAANIGAKVCLITMDMNKIAQMSCNPAVGGIAKGQIVREIDALGGQMGLVTDATAIQFRMLNRSKGPAVWSPRAQCDREKFITEWKRILDGTENLDIFQDQVEELIVKDGHAIRCSHNMGNRTFCTYSCNNSRNILKWSYAHW